MALGFRRRNLTRLFILISAFRISDRGGSRVVKMVVTSMCRFRQRGMATPACHSWKCATTALLIVELPGKILNGGGKFF
jgi:hypothetical protein